MTFAEVLFVYIITLCDNEVWVRGLLYMAQHHIGCNIWNFETFVNEASQLNTNTRPTLLYSVSIVLMLWNGILCGVHM